MCRLYSQIIIFTFRRIKLTSFPISKILTKMKEICVRNTKMYFGNYLMSGTYFFLDEIVLIK